MALALQDIAGVKVCRMNTGDNYVPSSFHRKQYAKETAYYWIPPSLVEGGLTPGRPIRYTGGMASVSGASLARWLHKLSHTFRRSIPLFGEACRNVVECKNRVPQGGVRGVLSENNLKKSKNLKNNRDEHKKQIRPYNLCIDVFQIFQIFSLHQR